MSELKRAYRLIRRALQTGTAPEAVADNAFLILSSARTALRARAYKKYPRLFASLSRLCEKGIESEDEVYSFFADKDEEKDALQAIPTLLMTIAILRLSAVIAGEKPPEAASDAVCLLRLAGKLDPDELFLAAWKPEKMLRAADPYYISSTPTTKAFFRASIAGEAKKRRLPAVKVAEDRIAKANAKGVPVSALSFPRPATRTPLAVWLFSFALLFCGLFSLCFFALGGLSFLCLLPLGMSVLPVCDKLASCFDKTPPAPRLRLERIPDEGRTVVAVTTLLRSEADGLSSLDRLERFSFLCPEENVSFCLLADLPEAGAKVVRGDAELLSAVEAKLKTLNNIHGERFFALVRERVEGENGRFSAPERKRGAVGALVKTLCGEKAGTLLGSAPENARYLLTLDADTELPPGLLTELLGAALHPANRVYGVFQPAVQTSLDSSFKTHFTRLVSGAAGDASYERAVFDRNMTLLGEGIFCGKGLLDLRVFKDTALSLPNGKILSHDLPEGGLARTLSLPDLSLCDSVPQNPISWNRRAHRWIRGDVQNLVLLSDRRLSFAAKKQIICNILRHLTPLSALLAILFGAILKHDELPAFLTVLFATAYLWLPTLYGLLSGIPGSRPLLFRRSLTKTLSAAAESLFRLGYEFVSLARNAFLSADAFCRSLWRMCVSKKKLLEWTTAADGELRSDTLSAYARDGLLSALTGTALFLSGRASAYRLFGLVFFLYPALCFFLSRPPEHFSVRPLSEKEKALLLRHASRQWSFFADNVTNATRFLPPDNLQFAPKASTDFRTSPTNIGLYLCSVLAAMDLGFCDVREGADRLERTLSSVEGLTKYDGNLYNWYDLKTGDPLGSFLSFVDSGNLAVCFATLAAGLTEYEDGDERILPLSRQASRLASETDLSLFFDKKSGLFSLGFDVKTNRKEPGCYDLLMSEARTASYFAVATGQAPVSHWASLSRTLARDGGALGMVSWSGTAFEYFMPRLFLPAYRNSFLQETLLFALNAQRKAMKNKLWGISESAYYGFDGELHYRYRAHGVGTLALRRDYGKETVFSPYSVFLTLTTAKDPALRVIKEYESIGMFGKYGLYEAYDTTPERGNGVIVASYMAHHVGMSLLAVANTVKDDVFVSRFLKDPRTDAFTSLLQEKIPAHPVLRPTFPASGQKKTAALPALSGSEDRIDLASPACRMLRGGNLTLLCASPGHIALFHGEKAVNDCRFERFSIEHSLQVGFTDNKGNLFGCDPFFGDGSYTFESSPEAITYISASKHFSGRVRFSFPAKSEVLKISAAAEKGKPKSVCFSFRPVLCDRASYDAHRSFSRLFLESSCDEAERILFFARRAKETGKAEEWLALALSDESIPFSFCTDEKSLGAERGSPFFAFLAPLDGHTGILTEPFFCLRTTPLPGGNATLLVAPAATREQAANAIRIARKDKKTAHTVTPPLLPELLTSALYFANRKDAPFSSYRRELLWKYGISGDFPLLGFSFDGHTPDPKPILTAWKAMANAGVRTELLFFPKGDGQYFRPAEKKLLSFLEECELSDFVGVRGGIFFVREEQTDPVLLDALPYLCASPSERKPASPVPSFVPPVRRVSLSPLRVPEDALPTACGYAGFLRFTVDRSAPRYCPLSYPLAGKCIGSIVTAASLGYTFVSNAHEHRLTPFFGDFGSIPDGETVYFKKDGTLFDLCACAAEVIFDSGTVRWIGKAGGVSYTVTAFCSPEKPFKTIRVTTDSTPGRVIYAIRPALGASSLPNPVFAVKAQDNALLFRSGHDPAFDTGVGLLFSENAIPLYGQTELYTGKSDGTNDLIGLQTDESDATFVLGGCVEAALQTTLSLLKNLSFSEEAKAAAAFARSFVPPIGVVSRSPSLDLFLNSHLPYQISASRFYCRASFRQSGGAFGFRDQLQDCLALIYSDKTAVRAHILRCASNQYEEGDVRHWWHEDGSGIRTTCSDDLLWLPYVLSDYLEKTDDLSILHEMVPYLSSPPLTKGENERFEKPGKSYLSESLLLHVLRAFDAADRRGRHGLLLMGLCDWNDAFSGVGRKGKGESVFSTFLYVLSAKKFAPFLEKEDPDAASRLRSTAAGLLANCEKHAFVGDRYLRAFCDDGTPLGVPGRSECEIDILTQAFALFAGADKERCKTALDTAEKELYDPKNHLLALFSPPFSGGNEDVGYVKGYPPGVRENGGQYTHAAVWGALAFLRIGKKDTALDLFSHMDPFARASTLADFSRYRSEPYALCADLCTGELAGLGGWSWYTGSAAWLYKVLLEEVFGVRVSADGCKVDFRPAVPCKVTFRLRPDCTLTLRAPLPADPASPQGTLFPADPASPQPTALLDGTPVSLPCPVPPGTHTLIAPQFSE